MATSEIFNSITSHYGLERALAKLSDALRETRDVSILDPLFDREWVIEIILIGLKDSLPIHSWILDSFPLVHVGFTTCFSWKLLSRLSNLIRFQSLPLPENSHLDRLKFDHMVHGVPFLLDTLSAMTFGQDSGRQTNNKPFYLSKGGAKKRKESTTCGKPRLHANIDSRLLHEFSISLPTNQAEKETTILTVLDTTKLILSFYLELITSPSVSEAIRTNFLKQPSPLSTWTTSTVDQAPAEAHSSSAAHAYPMVQPLRAARHFDSAEGFGEWRILISTRADGDLREKSRKDRTSFKIIVKKIKELSNGHFSDDNHKRLNGSNTDVPIFEAKMSRDSRLIYQIDSVSDYDRKGERQVIRIFGIYTHAQMDDRLWYSIGRQLGQKGKEYIQRCMFRKPAQPGDKVFLPATFPAIEEKDMSLSGSIPDLPSDDLEKIHSLLVLEKYMTFSQELLYTMLANIDVAFPFHVSPQEKEIIEFPYSCFVLGRSGTGKTTTMLFKMLWIERMYQLNSDTLTKPRQIFVTKSRVLAEKVEEYFTRLLNSLQIAAKSPEELKEYAAKQKFPSRSNNMIDLDDDDNWRPDLPSKFSYLQEVNFPLFITFDKLCSLLEEDYDVADRVTYIKNKDQLRNCVSFDVFLREYWPHFSQPLTKSLDPVLVFSEILGIITGSEDAASSTTGYLDRKTYEELSERKYSTFATRRSTIYSIFELYQARKQQRGEFDASDRTRTIIQMLTKHGFNGQKVDQLCVDEAQDNLLSDVLVLRSLCHNPDGLFWAGDTAQTISVGSSFRFDDLKSFLYRIEKQHSKAQASRSFIPSHPPKTFHLATNYRSHAGIVNCAHSIIELIVKFWPDSVDILAPEKGLVEGLRPVFLYGWDNDSVRYEQFLFGSSGNHIEFGAQQCILVRDEIAREKLREQVGDIGMIMTLYESKGLEFNDVLLYNFFEDSVVDHSQWRIILSALGKTSAPQFDETRHTIVCNELKFLYVAVTRARKNLWIADQSGKAEPMRVFWTSRNQIQNCTPGADLPRLAVSSSADEWAEKGEELFQRKHFLQAKHCYERASMSREVAISHAYLLRQQARKIPSGDSRRIKDQRHIAFLAAAESFLLCAGDAEENRIVYLRSAGECFEDAGEDLKAARAYNEACEYDTAARLFRKLGRFDDAIEVIQANEEYMKVEVVDSIKEVARLYYFREKEFIKARQLFSTDEDVFHYLEDLDLDAAHAEVLQSLGKNFEAAELHLQEGRPMVAIPLFLAAKQERSTYRAATVILQELWHSVSLDNFIDSGATSDLLDWSTSLDFGVLEPAISHEISMFRAVISHDARQLVHWARVFLSSANQEAAVLCLDHYFKKFFVTRPMTNEDLASILELFLTYVQVLSKLAFCMDPTASTSTARLFGFRRISAHEFSTIPQTLLHRHQQTMSTQLEQNDAPLSASDVRRILHLAVCEYLQRVVQEETEWCRRAVPISPCIKFAVSGFCGRAGCQHEHVPPSAMTLNWYNARNRVHLQQILIIQTLHSINNRANLRQKRLWISLFYEASHPLFFSLGSRFYLKPAIIPEFKRAIQVIKDWLRELAYTLTFDFHRPQYFLTDMLTGSLLGFTFDRHAALNYWRDARCLSLRIPTLLRPPDGQFVLLELISFLGGNNEASIPCGILSLRHIIATRLPINVSVLCDMLEVLCASTALAYRINSNKQFHGITLPRSWALRCINTNNLNDMKPHHPANLNLVLRVLFPSIQDLLESIFTGVGAEHLLFETISLAANPGVRGIFISRICRALCLLGYNIPWFTLRVNIVNVITSLRQSDRSFSVLYRQYVYARRWEELVKALRNTPQGILSDELLQFHDLRRGPKPFCPNGVSLLLYSDDAHIPHLLSTSEAPSEVTWHDNENTETSNFKEADMFSQSEDADAAEMSEIPDTDIAETEFVPFPSAETAKVHVPSNIELEAASIIKTAYRLSKRRSATSGRLEALQRYFSQCFEYVQGAGLGHRSYYRLLLLGPLPHLLICLESANKKIVSQKVEAKKRFLSASHQQLDEVNLELTRLGKSLKELLRLEKNLLPTLKSNIHLGRNVRELERNVQEAVDLIQTLPHVYDRTFEPDLELSIRGILKRLEVKPAVKPSIVLDEDFIDELDI